MRRSLMREERRCWAAVVVVLVGSWEAVWRRCVVTVLKSGILLQATREESYERCEYGYRDGIHRYLVCSTYDGQIPCFFWKTFRPCLLHPLAEFEDTFAFGHSERTRIRMLGSSSACEKPMGLTEISILTSSANSYT
jgi:hypothetical protein